jgi:hypothetical protein
MARSGKTPTRLSGRRGNIILGAAIAVVAIAAIINVPDTIRDNRYVKRDLATYDKWVAENGGRSLYGRPFPDEFGSVETHNRFDVVCFPRYKRPGSKVIATKMYLLLDSHGSGPTKVLKAETGPLRPKPTPTGMKCGKGPTPPPGA